MSFFNKKIFLIFLILKISYQNFNLNKFSLNSNMKSKLTNKEKLSKILKNISLILNFNSNN